MEWLFGGSSATAPQVPDTALRIQTAIAGKVRPVGCGMDRFAANLIQAMDFTANSQTVGGKGGVFGGGKGGAQSFTYTVAVLFGLCEGPIVAVFAAWDQQTLMGLAAIPNISVFLGDYAQVAPGYITTNHPDQADNNRGLAEIGIFPAQLGNSSALPNWSWEVLHGINFGIPGVPDADPRDWVIGLLINQYWSVHFPGANLDSLDQYSNWCRSTAMVISDTLVAAQSLNSYLQKLMEATDSEFVWSSGILTVVPYGDVTVTGNGATYVPPAAPVATLGDDDFLEITSGGPSNLNTKVRVQGARSPASNFDNHVQVSYLDRANSYNAMVIDAKDEVEIELLGYENNTAGARDYKFFKLQQAALVSAYLQLGRQLVRTQYYFSLGRKYLFLDPMDIVALNDLDAGLVDKWVRIKDITENQDGSFTYQAEEYLQGTATPYGYNAQTVCCINTELQALVADPGPTAFAYWDATLCGVADGPAIIVGAGGPGGALFPRKANKGLISDWYYPKYFADNPAASGAQTLFKSAPNDSGASFELKAIFSGAGANVQIGLLITATPEGLAPVTVSKYADGGPQASIPITGYGVIATWDFTQAIWAMHVRLNAGTTAVFSTNEGDPMDAAHPLFQNPGLSTGLFGSYQIGDASATTAFYYSQLWIGLDDDVIPLDLSIPDSVWTKFYCEITPKPYAPTGVNPDGSGPTGCPPTFYLVPTTPVTGSIEPGNSTGCLAGLLVGIAAGTFTGIGAGTIPNCGAYQAIGVSVHANSLLGGPEPFGGTRNLWGSASVHISLDGGSTYNRAGFIPGPSAVGILVGNYPNHVDPDTLNTFTVNLTESMGALPVYSVADADAGRSRCVMDTEIIDYTGALLVGLNEYQCGVYVRRGQLGTAPAAHTTGARFGLLGSNAITIKYPASLIGQTIHVKFTASNKTGGGLQTLADVPDHTITLVGPGAPAAPASLIVVEPVSSSGSVVASWPASTGCGVTGYVIAYNTGGPDTTIDLGDQLSTTLAGLAPGAYTFEISAVNSAGIIGGTPTTTTLTVT